MSGPFPFQAAEQASVIPRAQFWTGSLFASQSDGWACNVVIDLGCFMKEVTSCPAAPSLALSASAGQVQGRVNGLWAVVGAW